MALPVGQRCAGTNRQDDEKVDYAPSEEQLGQVEAAGGCGRGGWQSVLNTTVVPRVVEKALADS